MNERGYRRLLLAYPSWYRRERGEEMLTTLLDDAGTTPGRWASARDAADVLLGGVRCRLRVRGRLARSAATMAALAAGIGVAGVTGALAWQARQTMPTDAQAVAAVTDAVPDYRDRLPQPLQTCAMPLPEPTSSDGTCADIVRISDPFALDWGTETVPGDNDPATGRVEFRVPLSPAERATAVDDIRARLAATGWRLGPVASDTDGYQFWAAKGALTVVVSGNTPVPLSVDSDPLLIQVHHRATAAAGPAAVAGFTLGLLVGWLAAARTIRRYRRHRPAVRTAIMLCAVPGLVAATMLIVATTVAVVALAAHRGWSSQDWLVFAHVLQVFRVVFLATFVAPIALGLAAAAASLPLGDTTGRRQEDPTTR